MSLTSKDLRQRFDWPLLVVVGAISLVGVTNLLSATSTSTGLRSELYIQQIYWIVLGGALGALLVAIDYRDLQRYVWPAYLGGLVLLTLVFLLGRNVRGSQRWIPIGAFSLQPSEFMKLFLILALAKVLQTDVKSQTRSMSGWWAPLILLLPPMLLIMKQPDLGTAIILAAIFMTVMVLTRLTWRSLLGLVVVLCATAPVLWSYGLENYQRERFQAFWSPQEDLLDAGWHAHQSMVAIGSGGLWGKGYLQGTQNQHRFLPDQHTDFPFPVWAEEQGFVGVSVLLFLYGFLVLWGLKIGSQCKDRFGAILAVGVSSMIFWHVFINLGMVTGILPVVGVTLPLFSYGGSSVITVLMGVGLLLSVSLHRAN